MAETLFVNLNTLEVMYVDGAELGAMKDLPDYVNAAELTPEEWVVILRLERGGYADDTAIRKGLKFPQKNTPRR